MKRSSLRRSPLTLTLSPGGRGDKRRFGYTLLEVLLALGLSGMLMLLVYMAMQTFWQLSTTGRIDMERGQLARTLIRRMEMDIRSVTYKAPKQQQAAAGSEEQAADEGAGNVETGTDPDAASDTSTFRIEEDDTFLTADVHLIGTASSLEMIVLRPTRNRTQSPEDQLFLDAESDRRKVGYMFSPAGADGQGGLYYRNVDQQYESMMETQGNATDPLSQYLPIAAEIAYLEFQYLDGSTSAWVSEWHSRDMGGLPRAIKVTFQFHPAEAASTNRLRTSRTSASTDVFQTVVHLPLSEAPVEL